MLMQNTTTMLLKNADSHQDTAEFSCISSHYVSDMYTSILLICSLENPNLG